MESIEHTILKNLLYNEEYSRKVIPSSNLSTFRSISEDYVEEVVTFIATYNTQVTVEALLIEVSNRKDLNEGMLKELQILITNLEDTPETFSGYMILLKSGAVIGQSISH